MCCWTPISMPRYSTFLATCHVLKAAAKKTKQKVYTYCFVPIFNSRPSVSLLLAASFLLMLILNTFFPTSLQLTDFGLSRYYYSFTRSSKKNNEEEGGANSYMPPEAFDISYSPTRASDIYRYYGYSCSRPPPDKSLTPLPELQIFGYSGVIYYHR